MEKSILDQIKTFGLNKVVDYLDSNPDENIPKVIDWVERFDRQGTISRHTTAVKEILNKNDNNWHEYIKSIYADIDEQVRKKIFKNFLVNATIIGGQEQNINKEKHNCNIPWAILLDPTSNCNLNCKGCWASEYGKNLSLDFETLDDIIKQGKELGTYMYIYSGGEPLMRKDDIIKLAKKHDDAMFLAFTNGTLIDEEFAEKMLKIKNFVPAISIEGQQIETDSRRGSGTYDRVLRAMDILKEKNLPFGVSCCTTSENTKSVLSEEFIDEMISRGAKFAWFFTYMPVGENASPELMISAEQRKYMYEKIREFRKTKPIFTIDFWNDGEYINGCIGGGRKYLHINANGDIEPCAFIHYADSNIHEDSLLEAYKSPLFMEYKKNQPFNDNLLRPCPLLDNQYKLAEMVENAGAQSTELKNRENVHKLCAKCEKAAEEWAEVSAEIWYEQKARENKEEEMLTGVGK